MRTLAGEAVHEEVVKKSRFLARATRLDDPDEATEAIRACSSPDATHNCWAWKVGERYRFSDDGEPGGTAGRPILAAIEGQGLDHVLVVVTRWFGGIKLGAGGLVRAYGGTAARCLQGAETVEERPVVRLRVEVAFEDVGALHRLLPEAARGPETWTDQGLVLTATLPEDEAEAFAVGLRDATRGRGRVGPG